MQELKFICVLSFAQLSLLELVRLKDSGQFPLEITTTSAQTAVVICDRDTAKRLAHASGGVFKIARVCGSSIGEIENCLPLPDEPKFSWTVSGYCCNPDDLESAKDFVSNLLKGASLGKSRFVRPKLEENISELKIVDLKKNILTDDHAKLRGFDVVIDQCGGSPNFGYTEFLSDVDGFRERDMGRPYQDPTLTLSPRIARTLVSICGLKKGATVLDPFCGIGTILQEALVLGLNVVGVEISAA